MKITIVTREGEEHVLDGVPGNSLMETIRSGAIDELQAMCGGCCSCATCHVYVDPEFKVALPAISEDENDLLDSTGFREDNSRLSCTIRLTPKLEGLRAKIAPEN
jgi:2Fe-2S ferredoxin